MTLIWTQFCSFKKNTSEYSEAKNYDIDAYYTNYDSEAKNSKIMISTHITLMSNYSKHHICHINMDVTTKFTLHMCHEPWPCQKWLI